MNIRNKVEREKIIFGIIGISIIIIRIIINLKYSFHNFYGDEMVPWEISKSLMEKGQQLVRGMPIYMENFLYSIIIAPIHFISNYELRINFVIIFNTLLMSLGILPIYLLTQKILNSKRLSYIIVLLSLTLPEFTYSAKFIQESLYFTLLMFVFYQFYLINEERYQKGFRYKNPVILVLLSMGLYASKQIGLFMVATIILYYIIEIILENDKKTYLKELCIYVVLFIMTLKIYKTLYNLWMWNAENNIYQKTFKLAIDEISLSYLLKLIYPIFIYVPLVFLVTGALPLVYMICYFIRFNKVDKQLVIMIGCFITITILGVIFLITSAENFDQNQIRIHMRYLFYVIPIIIIMFAKACQYERSKDIEAKSILIFALLIIMINIVNIFPASTSSIIDGASTRIYYQRHIDNIINPDNYVALVKLFVSFMSIGAVYYILQNENKKVLRFGLIVFLLLNLCNNVLCYKDLQQDILEENKTEIQQVCRYINDNSVNSQYILLISEEYNKDIPLEIGMKKDYYRIEQANLKKVIKRNGEINLQEILFSGFDCEKTLSLSSPKYIIQRKNQNAFLNCTKLLETENYEVLMSNERKLYLRYEIIGKDNDNWINSQGCQIKIYDDDIESIRLNLSFIKEDLRYEVYCNNKKTEIDNRNKLVINKLKNDNMDVIRILPIETIRPIDLQLNDDSRELSLRIDNLELNK